MRFNATTSLVSNTTASVLGTGNKFTMVVWLRPLTSGEGAQARAFALDEAGNATAILLGGGNVIQLARVFSGGTGNWGVTNTGAIWEMGKWFCVAFTLDANEAANDPRIWVSKLGADGGMVERTLTTNTNTTGTPTAANTGFTIGNRAAADRTWDGDIAFLQVFDRILTQSEIQDCAFRPGKVKKDRVLYAPLVTTPWAVDRNGKRFANTTSAAVSKNGAPPGVIEYGKTGSTLGFVAVGGSGALSGTSSAEGTASGTLSGSGALSGTASATSTASGTLTNATNPALSGTASATTTASGTLSGVGALSGTSSATTSASAVIAGRGALAGTASGFSNDNTEAVIIGAGALSGTASATTTASGVLNNAAATGALSGSGSATTNASGTLTGAGAISGSSSATSSGSGILANTVPVQINFTDAALVSHVTSPGSNSIVQANLLECSIAGNESYYGFTETVSYTREVFIKQQMKFGADFDFGQGQKILRLRAFNVGGGVNYWDFIAQITSVGNSNPGQAGTNDSYQITVARNGGSTWGTYNKTITREQWYTFQYRYFLNSAQGVADGIFQMWLDGVQIFNITNLDLIGAATWNNTINRVLWGGWYSNGAGGNPDSAPSPSPAKYQIRNAYRSTAYISDTPAEGALTGSSSATSSASGTLSGVGALAGTSSATSSASGTLSNASPSGALSGTASATTSAVGALIGAGALLGIASAMAVGSGVLSNASTPVLAVANMTFANYAPHYIKVSSQ